MDTTLINLLYILINGALICLHISLYQKLRLRSSRIRFLTYLSLLGSLFEIELCVIEEIVKVVLNIN